MDDPLVSSFEGPPAAPIPPGGGQSRLDRAPVQGMEATTALFLQDLVLESNDVEDFLTNLATVAARHLSGPDQNVLCGVTLMRPRQAETLASSSKAALILDKLQYSFGDGPCLTAARTHRTVYVRDTRVDPRWPEYFGLVTEYGMHSILGVPIPLDGDADCGLNFYTSTANGFTPEAISAAEVFAREASRSLRLAVRIAYLSDKETQLNAALESRTIIDLAAGIIMAQNKCGQTAAMSILKTASNGQNTKLRDVAARLVTTVSHETPTTHFD